MLIVVVDWFSCVLFLLLTHSAASIQCEVTATSLETHCFRVLILSW